MKLSRIYIPTLGRVEKQTTYNGMPRWVQRMTYLVIQPHEEEAFRKKYPDANLLVLEDHIKGIAATRHWICERAGNSCYGVMDDDLTFWKRNIDRVTRKKTAPLSNEPFAEETWIEFFDTANRWFREGVGLGGCYQKGQIPKETEEKRFGKFTQCFFINGSLIDRKNLDWSLKWGEDIHFVLQCLRMGVETRISDKYLLRAPEFWSEGGCSQEGRTLDKDIECMKWLQNYWGEDIIKIVEKRYAPSGRYGQQTVGMKIRWMKVYNKYNSKREIHKII